MIVDPLARARLEKSLADHGFDLTPVFENDWLAGRSTQHPATVWLHYDLDDVIRLAAAHSGIRAVLMKEGMVCTGGAGLPVGAIWVTQATGFNDFYALLGRFAALARSLPNQVAKRFVEATKTLPTTTEAERLVVQRIGQNLFREALIDYWQGKCALAGLDVVPLLRASHIKPWADCVSDEERLDVFNGLLLAPHLDALFDGGWITFDEGGELRISPRLSTHQQKLIGLTAIPTAIALAPEHQFYLAHHREKVFL